jgi:hypothetical protein
MPPSIGRIYTREWARSRRNDPILPWPAGQRPAPSRTITTDAMELRIRTHFS